METPTTIWSKFTLFSETAAQGASQLLGALVFDSRTQLAPAGVRRSSPLKSRRLVYQADSLTICLEFQDSGDGFDTLMGEVLPKDELSFSRAELWTGEAPGPAVVATVSDLGYFTVACIRPGTYTLVLRTVQATGDASDGQPGEIILGPITFTTGC